MPSKPRVFICSTSKQTAPLNAITTLLSKGRDLEVVPWTRDVFGKNMESPMQTLLDQAGRANFAVFLMSPDDQIVVEAQPRGAVASNVIFELGLFLGRLGPRRCFPIQPINRAAMHEPTDLRGVVTLQYAHDDPDPLKALASACVTIRRRIREEWSRDDLVGHVAGRWLEIKQHYGRDQPYALLEFARRADGAPLIRGKSFEPDGSLRVEWPEGNSKIDYTDTDHHKIRHTFVAEVHRDGRVHRALGFSQFDFAPVVGERQRGRGHYINAVEGDVFKPGRTEFELRRITPQLIDFYLPGRKHLSDVSQEREFIRAYDARRRIRRVVLTGGAHSGKTTLINELRLLRYPALDEAALQVIDDQVATGTTPEEFPQWRLRYLAPFQSAVFRRQVLLEKQADAGTLFMDRSGLDCIAHLELEKKPVPPQMVTYAEETAFDAVFLLDPVLPIQPRVETGRSTTLEESNRTRAMLLDVYTRYGHQPVVVPSESVSARLDRILRLVDPDGQRR